MTRTLRRTALVPVLALVALASACSDDGGDTPDPAPSSAAPTSAAPTSAAPTASTSPSGSRGLGEDAAEALAARIGPAINLRASDLPGFTATPDDDDAEDDDDTAQLAGVARCLGLTAEEARDLLNPDDDGAEVASPDFERGDDLPSLTYSSSVSVDDEGGVASGDFARRYDVIFSSGGADCIGDFFAATIKDAIDGDPSATVRVSSSTLLVVPRQDGQRTGGLDVRMEAIAGGQRVPFNINVGLLFQDDTQVSFLALAAGQAVPTAQRNALLTTLSTRLAEEAP